MSDVHFVTLSLATGQHCPGSDIVTQICCGCNLLKCDEFFSHLSLFCNVSFNCRDVPEIIPNFCFGTQDSGIDMSTSERVIVSAVQ